MTDRPNLPTIYQKGYRKKNIQPHLEQEKIQPPRHLAKLSIWRGGLGFFDIDTQLKYIIRMHLKVITSQQCSVERSHVVLKLILNSDHGLALLKQKQILTGLIVTEKLQKSEDFFIQLLYAWLHLTNNNFPAFISIEEILDQPIFLNPHTRMDIKHPTQECFKFTIIRDLCRFL